MRSVSKSVDEAVPADNAVSPNFKAKSDWRPPSLLLFREMFGRLHHKGKWVNVSDGGHIENLGAFELLRRRCEVIIIGEGEADANRGFPGLSTLLRLAEIDLGVKITFPAGSLGRIGLDVNKEGCKQTDRRHFAVAEISYPVGSIDEVEKGYLLYVRSSLVGDEDQIISSYRSTSKSFPHESTADQMFNEGQFEAYRRLGVKMMSESLAEIVYDDKHKTVLDGGHTIAYTELHSKLKAFYENTNLVK